MTKPPAEPKLSATLLLIRDRANLEVLMVTRHYEIDFASGALVFPGGKCSEDDTRADWDEFVDGDFKGTERVARIAAVREAFEESGLLFARPSHDAPLVSRDVCTKLAPLREAVDRGEKSFLELIRDNGLVLALDKLVHFGHWITPVMMPKRFDTHFYVAPAPVEQIAQHDGRETTDTVWIEPGEALARAERKEATVIFPTRMNLRKLATASDVPTALDRFSSEPIVTVLPEVGKDEDGRPVLKIPDVPGYGQTLEPLDRIMG